MPFQPAASVNTAFWRHQVLDSTNVVIQDEILNLASVKKMKIIRNAQTSSQNYVWLWFDTSRLDKDPDLILKGSDAIAFIADIDAIFV
jgi:hypothetical protein